jgi:hypothetical protein
LSGAVMGLLAAGMALMIRRDRVKRPGSLRRIAKASGFQI